jgi:hypothetical protein
MLGALVASGSLLLLGTPASAQAPAGRGEAATAWSAAVERARSPSAEFARAAAIDRRQLLLDAEAALRAGDADQAATLFERAGFIRHDADAELGLVRSWMQRGEYRRAVAFAAHTAGAHPDVGAGAGLYAWLLTLGGQARFAATLLARARERLPADRVLAAAAESLAGPQPLPAPLLLDPPARFAPLSATAVPATGRVLGSGLLVGGRLALTDAGNVRSIDALWVRDGLGRVASARVARRFDEIGVAALELEAPGAGSLDPVAAPARDPFPGSLAYVVGYAQSFDAAPAWPMLRAGFLGRPAAAGGPFALGIEVPGGPRGAPVFDAAGQWIGIAVGDAASGGRVVPVSQLERSGVVTREATAPAQAPRLAADEIYERSLLRTVQVIGVAAR